MSNVVILILVGAAMFAVLGGVTLLSHFYNLNNIKSKTVGDGQHGTARWATKKEIRQTYKHIPFTPKRWREQAKNGKTPTVARAVKHKNKKGKDVEEQLYREILAVADENGGKLKNRCVFFADEFGTLPKIESAEMMFSAARSRRLQIVPIIQSFSQLDKNYGKEGAEIIVDNTQITLFGGFAPNSSSAETLSKALGSRTVMSGSISRGKDNPSQSLQMVERALMTPDELKALPKGDFIVMKTGVHPMRVHLKLFFKWGIEFDDEHPYTVPENGNRKVQYAEKKEIQDGIMEKYHPESVFDEPPVSEKANRSGKPHGDQQQNIFDEVQPLNEKERRKKRGGASETPEQTMIPPKEQVGTDGSP